MHNWGKLYTKGWVGILQIGIVVNRQKDKGLDVSSSFASLLTEAGIDCLSTTNIKNAKQVDNLSTLCNLSDIVVTFGGDGTVLGALTEVVKAGKPIASINLGYMGFLSCAEAKDISLVAQKLKDGKYNIMTKTLLDISIADQTFVAINEVVVSSSHRTNTISLSIDVDDAHLDTLKGDGVIVCTPTGSTAYALSAGGAVLSPDIKAFEIVQLCAHSLHNKPIVYNDDSKVKITVLSDNCTATADGQILVDKLTRNSVITVTKSKKNAKFILLDDVNFYDRLLSKLLKWSK